MDNELQQLNEKNGPIDEKKAEIEKKLQMHRQSQQAKVNLNKTTNFKLL